jgi:hypothetical protein
MSVTEAPLERAAGVGTYVYAVTWADEAAPQAEGVTGAAVVPVVHRDLAALVSHVDTAAVRARRRDLLRHSEVVIAAAGTATVLPVGFGTVFAAPDALIRVLLEPRHDDIVSLLRNFEGLVETTVHATYDEDAVLHSIAGSDAHVARLRGRVGAELELGRAVAGALAARREDDRESILRRLRPLVHDVAVEEPQSELEVLRAALLVDRAALAELDGELAAIASQKTEMSFKYVGPLPAFHFARLPGVA